jgi:cephalosporin-C deacetylase-like acetyl esterase
VIKQVKDIMRSIDYLETRPDIDSDKVAYFGRSWGAFMGTFPCAADQRIKVGILGSGCLFYEDVLCWAQRVEIPILMINGRYDSTFAYKETQVPLFQALHTPEQHKRHRVFETGHVLAGYWKEMIKESLSWLDKYLGPVNKKQ